MAVLLVAAALAAPLQARVVAGPAHAHTPWRVQIVLTRNGRPYRASVTPQLGLLDAGGAVTRLIPSRRTKRAGVYAVTVVFPHAGAWRYWVSPGGEGAGWYFSVRVTA